MYKIDAIGIVVIVVLHFQRGVTQTAPLSKTISLEAYKHSSALSTSPALRDGHGRIRCHVKVLLRGVCACALNRRRGPSSVQSKSWLRGMV